MYLNNIVVNADGENQETVAEIVAGIKFLLQTPTGKYPMNRDFGIDQNLQDKPVSSVQSLLAIEIKDKIERYEPRVEVTDVSFEYDETSGVLSPIIEIDLISVEEGEDEEYRDEDFYDDEDEV